MYTLVFFVVFPILQLISIRSHDGVRTHYSNFQGRFLSLFYTDQVDLIKSTRKALKQKVRSVVDRVGPQVFKNFDKMRLIMFDPQNSERKYRISKPSNSDDKKKKTEQKEAPKQNKLQKSAKEEPLN